MYESNQTDFKPKEGDLPDTMERFKMEEGSATATKYSDNEPITIFATFIAIAVITFIVSFYNRTEEEDASTIELEKETNKTNVAKIILTKQDLGFTQDSLQAQYSQKELVKQHQKSQEITDNERKIKQLILDEEPLFLEKPRNFKKEAREKQKLESTNRDNTIGPKPIN